LKGLKLASSDLLNLIATESAKPPKKLQQPLQALREAMNESDKNCNGQNAKRKPLSDAGASSKKRSSTG
jgi:hypothetical protein